MGYLYLCDITTNAGDIYRKIGWSESPKIRISTFGRYGSSVKFLDCLKIDNHYQNEQKILKEWRDNGWQIQGPHWIGKTECFSQDAPTLLPDVGEKVCENDLPETTRAGYLLKLDDDLLDQIKVIAKSKDRTVAQLVRDFFRSEIEAHKQIN